MKTYASKSTHFFSFCLLFCFAFVRPTFAAVAGFPFTSSNSLSTSPDAPDGIATIGGITLTDAEVCTSIESREPVGAGSHFSSGTDKIWVFTKFSQEKIMENEIKHVYYFEDQMISSVPLNIQGKSFRTWSYKTISPKMAGKWRVEVTSSDGELFESIEFTVTP